MKILLTGAAGFIGAALSHRLLECGHEVVAVDNLSDYYDVTLKLARLERLRGKSDFYFKQLDISHSASLSELFKKHSFEIVINLAAQAGVRYSLTRPDAYVSSNITGFLNILESCRHHDVKHLVYASSSSVYGGNKNLPFSVNDSVDHPLSMYAASKKANELMAHSYSHLYRLPTTGLRFFSVYGPWGRPDMAMFTFTKSILEGKPIELFNNGKHLRDFTYIDDIVQGILLVLSNPPGSKRNSSPTNAPYLVYNVGNNSPVWLSQVVETLEKHLGKTATKTFLPLQPGDVSETFADISELIRDFGYQPKTSIDAGIEQFVRWYKEYYKIP